MGSDIFSKDASTRTITTLFQHTLSDSDIKNLPFPISKNFKQNDQSILLTDKNGTGYYLPKNHPKIIFKREFSKNPFYKSWNPKKQKTHDELVKNEGNTEFAILDHGKAPNHLGYEFCILVRSSGDALKAFSSAMAQNDTKLYQVLQKNAKAHIVFDRPSNTTAYALFEAGSYQHGPLLSISEPAVFMARPTKSGDLQLSIADPRISGDHSDLDHTEITLTIKGLWETSSKTISNLHHKDGNTTMTVKLKNLLHEVWTLSPNTKK